MEAQGQAEKLPLHSGVFSKFVGIDEKSFNLNDYAEELQQFEELLEEYGKDVNLTPTKQKTDKDYFMDTEPVLSTALSLRTHLIPETIQSLIKIVNEWDTGSSGPIETNFGAFPENPNSKSKAKVLELKLEKVKTQLSQFEFHDLKLLQEEIQKLTHSKDQDEDPYLYHAKLSKLNRNLSVLKDYIATSEKLENARNLSESHSVPNHDLSA